eukprot:NODE_1147_length_1448_cov_73.689629_g1136_i0.p1 GENE.NODE_1147_length_1448_cov_73.689629_g1136_i0~~NODE_1147_length_1448_cov_73.689629_g1136_i0.p1  ORF type:complete len:411 (+),score=40.90 NODE_1147_length_1448_cov_73.689629_g1136_i0:106-1338(+)
MWIDENDTDEQRRINEVYALWKRSAPLLYKRVNTHVLEWPTTTVSWMPRSFSHEPHILVGTHTTQDSPNSLLICGVDHDAFEPRYRIPHNGGVNRARAMPQSPSVIATKTSNASVDIFDVTKTRANDGGEAVVEADLCLSGHKKEGHGLDWSPSEAAWLASGGDDNLVCVWDIGGCLARGVRDLSAVQVFNQHKDGHTDVVEDVCWHPKLPRTLASASGDRSVKIWDLRASTPCAHTAKDAHTREVNCLAYNPVLSYVLATGGADKVVKVWDTRYWKKPWHEYHGHEDEVYNLRWSPHNALENLLASSSLDRKIIIWDMDRHGLPQPAEDKEDAPPELAFVHAGHTSRITDFAWHPEEEWTIASVAEDNLLQVWTVAERIYCPEDDRDGTAAAQGDGDTGQAAQQLVLQT